MRAFAQADRFVSEVESRKLRPAYVFVAAGLSGLVRPCDQGMRNALVGKVGSVFCCTASQHVGQ